MFGTTKTLKIQSPCTPNLHQLLGPSLEPSEVASLFSVNEEDVLRYYKDFGGVRVTPNHHVFFQNLILQRMGYMPTLDKRQKSGPRWKGVVQVNRVRKELRFPDASQKSYNAAVAWENEERTILHSAKRPMKPTLIEPKTIRRTPAQVAPQPVQTPTTSTEITLEQFANTYLDDCKLRHVTKTYKEKRACFRDLMDHFGKNRDLATITPLEANQFMHITGQTRPGYAVNKIKKNFNAGWNWASTFIENMPKKESPFKSVRNLPETRFDRYVPPKEDFDKVLEVLDGQDLVMMKTYYFTGARKSEIFRTKWEDVLFDKDCIRLWTKKRRGGNMENDLIPMVSELKKVLLGWKEHKNPKSEKEHLFINEVPQSRGYGKPFVDRTRFLRKACEDAGVKYFGYHGIRHLTATQLFHAGHPVNLIQQILRHKNPNTTAKYLHSLGLNKALEAIDGTF